MNKKEFTDYCLSIGVTPHFKNADEAAYGRSGVDYFVTLFFEGKDCGEQAASEGNFKRAKDMAEFVAGLRRAVPGSQFEDELVRRGESLMRAPE